MKNNLFHSFRFELIKYSLLSLLCVILTEAGIVLVFKGISDLVKNISGYQEKVQPAINNRMIYNTANSVGLEDARISEVVFLVVFGLILGIVLFTIYFLIFTKKFAIYIDEIARKVNDISGGDFDARIDIRFEDEFTVIASRINKMADDVKRIMENERKSEVVKNDLITSVAHDLRTPLTSIIGYLDLVSNKDDLGDEVRKQYISIAYNKSKRLERLIEDLFAYTKFSTEEIAIYPSEMDMVKFLEQLVDEFYPSFQEAGLEYEFQTSHSQAIIEADGDLLVRAFANLISNAVKYGKDGKSIKIKLVKKIDHVIVTITNFGELIPEKDLDNIFDRFYRVESSRSSKTGGTGLGLAIAKNIIKLHGGVITARSDFSGTVFEVMLKTHLEKGEDAVYDQTE